MELPWRHAVRVQKTDERALSQAVTLLRCGVLTRPCPAERIGTLNVESQNIRQRKEPGLKQKWQAVLEVAQAASFLERLQPAS